MNDSFEYAGGTSRPRQRLTVQDQQSLLSSFITPEVADAAQLFRVGDEEGAELMLRKRSADANFSGIVFSYFQPPNYDRPIEYRLRRDHPDYERNSEGEVREVGKYLSPRGARNALYFPPGVSEENLSDTKLPIVIVEGEKKLLAIYRVATHKREGGWEFLPIGLPGVWNFRGVIGKTTSSNGARTNVKGIVPDFDRIGWAKRRVTILFDTNVRTNSDVRAARSALTRALRERGAKVFYAELPESCDVNGIDDYLGQISMEYSSNQAVKVGLEILAAAKPPGRSASITLSNFQLVSDGDRPGIYFQDGDGERLFVCSPLHITAETFTPAGEEYGRMLEWKDSLGRSKQWAMPIKLVHSERSELFTYLSSVGLQIGTTRKQHEWFREYINLTVPDEKVICTDRVGWHGGQYVLPDECIGEGVPLVYQPDLPRKHKFNQLGSHAEWVENVARYCVGNSRLAFAVSVAFAGPLLPILNLQGGGFHFFGPTSIGKTTAERVAGSVYGGSDEPLGYSEPWRTTDNGLEALLEEHNDGLLCLDEIGQCSPAKVGEIAYMVGNGHGKNRLTRNVVRRIPPIWRLYLISSGEKRLEQVIAEAGHVPKGGQLVRVCDIPADTGVHGILENLHGYESSQTLVDHLVEATQNFHGTPIRAFLSSITKKGLDEVRGLWTEFRDVFEREFLHLTAEFPAEVRRVAAHFSVVAFAGELASELGITGWEKGDAAVAAAGVYRAWLSERIGSAGTDAGRAVLQVTYFLQANGQSRFPTIPVDPNEPDKVSNRAGFKRDNYVTDETHYLIFPEVFRREVCKGFDPKFVLKELKRLGVLITDSCGYQKNERLPEMGQTKVYAVSSRIFELIHEQPPEEIAFGKSA